MFFFSFVCLFRVQIYFTSSGESCDAVVESKTLPDDLHEGE